MLIKPTIGRVVWYHPSEDTTLPAIICHVWNDSMINIAYFGMSGEAHAMTSVWLWQEGVEFPKPMTHFCEWMPYQVGQARASVERHFT